MMDLLQSELHEFWDSFSNEHQSFLISNAIKQDETSLYRFFVTKGVDVNFQTNTGDTFLTSAICLFDHDLISFLIRKGANVNLQNERGETPLVFSIYSGSFEDTLFLLKKGASLDATYASYPYILEKIVEFPKRQIQLLFAAGAKNGSISETMKRKINGEKMKELVR